MSLLLTKTMELLGTMRSATLRSLKLIMAAMRLRSVELRMDLGVRCKTPINSSVVWGVYLGFGVESLDVRNLSSLGSSQ